MRLWSLHPGYLDSKGLVAVWREGLLARKVLRGKTSGYRHHPQLERFRNTKDPVKTIDAYLSRIWDEAASRGYKFDRRKIRYTKDIPGLTVTQGQLDFEWRHLMEKLKTRSPDHLIKLGVSASPEANPFFRVIDGDLEAWERIPS